MKQYYVYIVTNRRNGTLYIGMTNDLIRRVMEHKQKLIPGFSSKYNLTKLAYYETHQDPSSAIQREKQLKNLLRKKKILLIENQNKDWEDLYSEISK